MKKDAATYQLQLNETTFLLCKPDAERMHRTILQWLSEAGFHVQAKTFIMNTRTAEWLVKRFPSVEQRLHGDPPVEPAPHSSARDRRTDALPVTAGSGHGAGAAASAAPPHRTGAVGSSLEPSSSTARTSPPTAPASLPREKTAHQLLMEIKRIALRHHEVEAGVNAGLPSSPRPGEQEGEDGSGGDQSSGGEEAKRLQALLPSDRVPTGAVTKEGVTTSAATVSVQQRGSTGNPGSTPYTGGMGSSSPAGTAAVGVGTTLPLSHELYSGNTEAAVAALRAAALETMSAKEYIAEHVRHLAHHGTCLAVLLAAPNAVERLRVIVGPENPSDARRVAPNSIRARLGVDLVRNAVYAAADLAEAAACISTVFGYDMSTSSADVKTFSANGLAAAAGSSSATAAASTAAAAAAAVNGIGGGGKGDRKATGFTAGSAGEGGALGGLYGVGYPAWRSPARPAKEMLHLHEAGPAPLTLRALLPSVTQCSPESLTTYYTGHSPTSAWAREGRHGQRSKRAGAGKAAEGGTVSAEEQLRRAQREVAVEREYLTQQARLLHAREVDLLLREQALQWSTEGLADAPHALTGEGHVYAELRRPMRTTVDGAVLPLVVTAEGLPVPPHTTTPWYTDRGESGGATVGLLRPPDALLTQSSAACNDITAATSAAWTATYDETQRRSGAPQAAGQLTEGTAPEGSSPATNPTAPTVSSSAAPYRADGGAAEGTAAVVGVTDSEQWTAMRPLAYSTPPVLEQSEAAALLKDDARRRALFHALDVEQRGRVRVAAIVDLYTRSVSLHLPGEPRETVSAEDVARHVRGLTKAGDDVDFNGFSLVLANFLKQ